MLEGTLFVNSSSVFFNGSTIFDGNEGYITLDYPVRGGAIYMRNSTVAIQGTANFTENSITEDWKFSFRRVWIWWSHFSLQL